MGDNHVTIESEQCKGCGLCAGVCPKKCLEIGLSVNGIGHNFVEFRQNGCTACGFCYYICPEPGAITVYTGVAEGYEQAVHVRE
ncbi:MAG: 4Fe-4S binding protein [Spirochaetes bacterium]|nr:4Fe-4S binding protein [Spirochaetota bacterium]